MLREFLVEELPVPEAPPTSLHRGERLCSTLVREATGWLLGDEDIARTPIAIASLLMDMYCGGEALAVNTDTEKAEDDLHLRLDAQCPSGERA